MGLPKNYQKQSTQINKRVESLNDLNFYEVTYEFRFTKAFMEQKQDEGEDWDEVGSEFGSPLSLDRDSKYVNTKKFSALDDESAERKITEWLDKQVENKIMSEYDIISIDKNNLHDVLKEKGLLPFLDLNKEK